MKILVVGSGGREHTLVWKIKQSPQVEKIYCAPGNAGIGQIAECVNIKVDDFKGLADFAKDKGIDLTVVGPEIPLAGGIVDFFQEQGLKIFGPNKKAAQLEASKVFSKEFMKKYKVNTAKYEVFSDCSKAIEYIDSYYGLLRRSAPRNDDNSVIASEAKQSENTPLVVKADGLAAGKGVIIAKNPQEAKDAIKDIMENKSFGEAGNEIVIEEFLDGEEASVMVFMDGESFGIMVSSQDHKRAYDNDEGPNTGGMGAYAPAPIIDNKMEIKVAKKIIMPIMHGLEREGIEYKGVLYIGLMIVKGNPYVLEFNCRFGDPETQVVLPLLKSDLVEIMQKIAEKKLDKIEIEWYNKTAVCVVLASGGYPGSYEKGKEIKGLEEIGKVKDIIVFHAGTSLKDNKTVTSGGRVLGVTSLDKGIPEAIDKVYKNIGKVSFDKMHYRTDIGKRALTKV